MTVFVNMWLCVYALIAVFLVMTNCEIVPVSFNITSDSASANGWTNGLLRKSRRSSLVDACTTNSGVPGTCMTRLKCARQGGSSNGYCGTYGVCCESEIKLIKKI